MIPEMTANDVQLTHDLHGLVLLNRYLTQLGAAAKWEDWVDYHERRTELFLRMADEGYADMPLDELERGAAWARFERNAVRGLARRQGGDKSCR